MSMASARCLMGALPSDRPEKPDLDGSGMEWTDAGPWTDLSMAAPAIALDIPRET